MATDSTNTSADNDQPDTSNVSDIAPDSQVAANLIRQKVSRIYADEPDTAQELAEAEAAPQRSKHQQFMYELSTSGKDLAAIQTEWHDYYQQLPASEQHQVWHEFYASQSALTGQPQVIAETPAAIQALAQHKHQATATTSRKPGSTKARKLRDARSAADIQAAIRHKVSAGGQLQAKHHLQSLLFGLGMGMIVVIIFLFGFFNEVIIAPFIQPSRVAAATPLIISSTSVAPTTTPEVIIPKINVEIPVNYNETSTDENAIENDLEDGVVHYPTTVLPGQTGNAAFFGHSSNNIFNKGKYKFAFVLLHTLVPGDTFYLTYGDKVYVYKVISRTIVDPSDVGVLGPVPGQTATATLITCDPPGTSLHRLIVVGQQISPDPSGNTQPTTTATTTSTPTSLPGNGPTLWSRFIRTGLGKASIVIVLVAAFLFIVRWFNKPLRPKP
ncbi:MAG TPA: class E sortase [Verrucomicrobiae bacterium]|jgi:LPXTG-site transpeptidase (sortase) family protein|nr:class E sortase [Verrucomicrobiae bacterium]